MLLAVPISMGQLEPLRHRETDVGRPFASTENERCPLSIVGFDTGTGRVLENRTLSVGQFDTVGLWHNFDWSIEQVDTLLVSVEQFDTLGSNMFTVKYKTVPSFPPRGNTAAVGEHSVRRYDTVLDTDSVGECKGNQNEKGADCMICLYIYIFNTVFLMCVYIYVFK